MLNWPGKRRTLLCIDDHRELLAVFTEFLEVCGYKVLTAVSGREGLTVLSLHHVDGVIIDYEMPEKRGDVVAKEIKRLYPNLPVLMLSGYGSLPRRELRAVDIVLDKNTFPEKLLLEISTLLEKFASALSAKKKPVRKVGRQKLSKRRA